MIKAIQKLFNTEMHSDAPCSQQQLDLATAALLAEIVIADNNVSEAEVAQLKQLLTQDFNVSLTTVNTLIELALAEVNEANDVHQFTRLINEHFVYEDKCKLIKALWKVAFADAVLDKYEEYNIRKISELIYVAHNDFIVAKMAVKAEMGL